MNKKHLPTSRDMRRLVLGLPQIEEVLIALQQALVIGVGILKGGTGKSTSTLYMALWFAIVMRKRVCVLDTDSNSQSLSNWCAMHEAMGETIPFALVEHSVTDRKGPSLGQRLAKLRTEYDVVLVDIGGGDKEAYVDLCEYANLLLIPVAPSGWETSRLQASLETAQKAARLNDMGLHVYVMMIKCNFTTTLPEEARAVLESPADGMIPPPMMHPYFDVSGAPQYVRSWTETPKIRDLEEFGQVIRHAMTAIEIEETS